MAMQFITALYLQIAPKAQNLQYFFINKIKYGNMFTATKAEFLPNATT